MIKVWLASPLTRFSNGEKEIGVEGTNLAEALKDLDKHCEGIKACICDEHGELKPFVNVYVNEEDARFKSGLETPLADGDEVAILVALRG